MQYNAKRGNSTVTTQVTCAVLFAVFAFAWLFWFHADCLALAQHTLSEGQTHYDRTIGAVIITASLLLLERAVLLFVRLRRHTHALTYLPSLLLLAMLTDVGSDTSAESFCGKWAVVVPIVLVAWGIAAWLSRQMMPFANDKVPSGLFSRRVWVNVFLMVGMMLGTASLSNTEAVFHFRAHAETSLARGDSNGALMAGEQSLETDESLTMLRAYALSRQHQLGDRLFNYTLKGTSADLLPAEGSNTRLLILPSDSIWHHLGAYPAKGMDAMTYLRILLRDTVPHPQAADYQLCAHLIDRRLDDFAADLPRFYRTDSLLPRHYSEALVLRNHLGHGAETAVSDTTAEQQWTQWEALQREDLTHSRRMEEASDRFGRTYWFYYYYGAGSQNDAIAQ
mgnify:CR=1 FL=1